MPTTSSWAEPLQGRRVLVTGASGFIGRWVARALSRIGADLWLLARHEDKLSKLCDSLDISGHFVTGDCAKAGVFRQVFGQVRPDLVFNLAGYGVDRSEREEDRAWAINTRLPEEIADTIAQSEAADWPGVRLIHAGSAAEYGSVDTVLTESSLAAPASLYGRSKLAGTMAIRSARERTKLRAVTARLFTVYGPGEHEARLLPSLMEASRTGGAVKLTTGQQKRDFTYVTDAVEGLLRLSLFTGSVPPVVNLATGKLTSVRAFAECAAEVLGLRESQLQFGVLPEQQDEVKQGPADTRLARELLGWVPACTPRDGITRMMEFATCGAAKR